MRTNGILRASLIFAGAFALATGSATAREVHPTMAESARTTLEQMHSLAKDAAARAELYGRQAPNLLLNKADHADQLDAVKTDVNQMGKDVARLEAERQWLTPWEQKALDQVKPELQLAATNTEHAIAYFNGHTGLWTPENENTLRQITNETSGIATTVGDYLKLDTLRHEEHKIEHQMNTAKTN